MNIPQPLDIISTELDTAIVLPKCQKCGCMQAALDSLAALLPQAGTPAALTLAQSAAAYQHEMQPVQYECLGCPHCYAAEAQNAFALAFPTLAEAAADLSCDFREREQNWPPVVGEYVVLDPAAPVAVSTLGSIGLAEVLGDANLLGLAIVGKTETENIGLDKIIKNTITNPAIRYLLVAGEDAAGHFAGQTLLALWENGVDENGRVRGAEGKRPVLRNVTLAEVEAFRAQVQVEDMIGCTDVAEIIRKIENLVQNASEPCGCSQCGCDSPAEISEPPTVTAASPDGVVRMDKAGYFVIVPLTGENRINVEHYDYDHTLLRVIEGEHAADIYKTILENGWVTELSHAAYLGKELAKAELSIDLDFKYVQDGA